MILTKNSNINKLITKIINNNNNLWIVNNIFQIKNKKIINSKNGKKI